MSENTASLNTLWATLIIEELVRNRVTTFVISPGSRSTPLTVAAARNPKAETIVHFDERGAAFFALGVAKARGFPCALICTSGTAVANYFPAIVEASQSCVPLIVLTADRPPELQNTGANQTINQTEIYGGYVREFAALPCPEEGIAPEVVLTTIDQAVFATQRSPAGPVHVNCPFREPLIPVEYVLPGSLTVWRDSNKTYTQISPYNDPTSSDLFSALIEIAREAKVLLVVGGKATHAFSLHDHFELALNASRWPVFPDISSDARVMPGSSNNELVIPYYDQLLLSEQFRAAARPDVVVHIGGAVVSKRLQGFLSEARPRRYIHISPTPFRLDPNHGVTHRIEAPFPTRVGPLWGQGKPTAWARRIGEVSAVAELTIASMLDAQSELSEPGIMRVLGIVLRETRSLTPVFIGNSMPIRDMDMFCGSLPRGTRVFANRGASGIDGNIATAAGTSWTDTRPIIAIIGDVAAMHDLNSLALLARADVPVILIVINNDGGGIFNFLPVALHADVFEPYFGTPHGRNFKLAAEMFGLQYSRPANTNEFNAIVRDALQVNRSQVIEVMTNRAENLRLHREIGDAVAAAVDAFLGTV